MAFTRSREEGEVSSSKSGDGYLPPRASTSSPFEGLIPGANPAVRQMQMAARGMNPTAPPYRPSPQSFVASNHFPIVPAIAVAMRNSHPPTGPAPRTGGPGPFPIPRPASGYGPPSFGQGMQSVGPRGNYVNQAAGPSGPPIIPNQTSFLSQFTPYSYAAAYTPPINQSQTTGHGVDMGGTSGPPPPPKGATPTQRLSYECQRRHFNPVFNITEQANGRYKCNIVVKGVVVEGGHTFGNTQDAKNHTAAKAVKVMKEWLPVPPSADLSAPGPNSRPEEEDSQPEVEGMSAAVDISDPGQARAFAEGFKMGLLAACQDGKGSSGERARTRSRRDRSRYRSRSRTPRRDRERRRRHRTRSSDRESKSKRERSPPRYHDGSRHDPSLPSTDKYRPSIPSTDRYRPNEPETLKKEEDEVESHGRLKVEDSYGRLKGDDLCYED